MVMPYHDYPVRARERGFRVCAIWDPSVAAGVYGDRAEQVLARMAEEADDLRMVDFADPQAFERAVRDAVTVHRPRFVYHTGAEETMLATYRIAEELGLEVNPASSIRMLNDKLELRRALAGCGVSPVRFAGAEHWRDVARLLPDFTLPVVVKPTTLSGSRAVCLLRDGAELPAWGAALASYDYQGPVLVEEYLHGPEYSVETISVRGRHHVVGVTRKLLGPPPWFVEAGHVHPEPDQTVADLVSEPVVPMLDAVGYRTGPAHTEVKLTARGPRVVESQARPGGDMIPRLVRLSRGFDTAGAIFDALAGRPPRPAIGSATARIHYFRLPSGRIHAISGLDDARALDFVDELRFPFRVGDVLPRTVDWRTRHGFVIVRGDSSDQTLDQVRMVESIFRVEVGGGRGVTAA